MNRIDKTLAGLQAQAKKVLSPYITAGDPDINASLAIMHQLVDAGADILEIGIPFSDPMAEGVVIQAAMERALARGVHVDTVFSLIQQFRQDNTETPIVLMGYLNPIEQYGYEYFVKTAVEAGADGIIVVDLPPEEAEDFSRHCKTFGLQMIYLCSPTTSKARLARLSSEAQSYLYYVSLKGVTGADMDLNSVKQDYLRCKAAVQCPLMLGFGIKTPALAAAIADFADGVIVGAALVDKIYTAYRDKQDGLKAAFNLVSTFRQAMDKGIT
jgi:tryptophan synthase alpha chain